jgi:hypothetical protein
MGGDVKMSALPARESFLDWISFLLFLSSLFLDALSPPLFLHCFVLAWELFDLSVLTKRRSYVLFTVTTKRGVHGLDPKNGSQKNALETSVGGCIEY